MNVDAKTLQSLLGHADIRTLLKYYVLPDNDSKKQAIDRHTTFINITNEVHTEAE